MRVSYEKLKSAPQQTFAELFQFMGLPFSADDIRRAVEDCVFERLQMRERAASGANPSLTRGDPGNPDCSSFAKVVAAHTSRSSNQSRSNGSKITWLKIF